jgi:hypothetical protein
MPPTCSVLSSAGTVLPAAGRVSIEFVSFGDPTFDAIEKGRLDLLLNADDGYLPPRFASEVIFDDNFLCVAAKETKYPKALTLKQYLAAETRGRWNLERATDSPR